MANHFVGQFSGPPVVQQNEHGTIATPGETVHYIVDKNTCKGLTLKYIMIISRSGNRMA